jgi:hypothetical protein
MKLILAAQQLAAGAAIVSGDKPPCEHYFGTNTTDPSLQVTVVDPDVHNGFPFANETFMHHTGVGSLCLSPGPPVGCHRCAFLSEMPRALDSSRSCCILE